MALLEYIALFEKIVDRIDFAPLTSKKCKHNNHDIEVQLDSQEIRLYLDHELVDSRKVSNFPSPSTVLLRGPIDEGDDKVFITVYGKSGLFRAKVKICANEVIVGGDVF